MLDKQSQAGLALLIGCVLFILTIWGPIVYTVYLSFQDYDLLRPASWVGLENYSRLLADSSFRLALGNGIGLAFSRAVVTGLTWQALQLAWQRRQRIPAWSVLLAVAPLPFVTPTATALLWRLLTNSVLGPLGQFISFQTPSEARWSLYLIDSLHTLAFATAIGLVIYHLAQRGQQRTQTGHPDALALRALLDRSEPKEISASVLSVTGRLAVLIAAASGLQSFAWSYVITQAGPENATLTPIVYLFRHTFNFFRMGSGAAVATVLIGLLLIPGLLWWSTIKSGSIQIDAASPSQGDTDTQRAAPSALLILLSFVPAAIIWLPLGLIFLSYTELRPAPTDLLEQFPWLQWYLNGLLAAGLAVWLVQIPVAFLIAYGIVFMGRVGQAAGYSLSGPFLLTGLINVSVVSVALFPALRELEGLNTRWGFGIAWGRSELALVLFLFFLNGRRVLSGQAIWPAIAPLSLLLGFVNMYWASQDLYWPVVIQNSPDLMTPGPGLFLAFQMYAASPSVALFIPSLVTGAITSVCLVLLAGGFIRRMTLVDALSEIDFKPGCANL